MVTKCHALILFSPLKGKTNVGKYEKSQWVNGREGLVKLVLSEFERIHHAMCPNRMDPIKFSSVQGGVRRRNMEQKIHLKVFVVLALALKV